MNVTPPLAASTNQNLSQSQNLNAQLTKPATDSAPIKGITTSTPVGKVSCNNKNDNLTIHITTSNKSSHFKMIITVLIYISVFNNNNKEKSKDIFTTLAFHHLVVDFDNSMLHKTCKEPY